MTYHANVAQAAFEKLSTSDRELLRQLECVTCIDPTHACATFRSWFHQPHPSVPLPPTGGQLWALAQLEAARSLGKIAVSIIDIGVTPGPDADVAANQAKLDAAVAMDPDLLEAVVDPGSQKDDDGYLRIRAGLTVCTADGIRSTLRPTQLPLEIGATQASRTMAHLELERAVVRWPYGSTALIVLADVTSPRGAIAAGK